MGNIRMLKKIFHSADDGRNTGFVISPKKSRPIGEEDILSLIFQDFRKRRRRKNDTLFLIEDNILAIIRSHPDRLDVFPGRIGAGVDVGNETDYWAFCPVCRQRGHDIAVFVQGDMGQANSLQFRC